MQTDPSKIWNYVADSIPYADNRDVKFISKTRKVVNMPLNN